MRKANIETISDDIDYSVLVDEASINILKEISRYPDVIKEASVKMEPFVIARYAVSIAQAFNHFYHENQINVEDQTTKMARLKVVEIAKSIIKDALSLLGIGCPEQM